MKSLPCGLLLGLVVLAGCRPQEVEAEDAGPIAVRDAGIDAGDVDPVDPLDEDDGGVPMEEDDGGTPPDDLDAGEVFDAGRFDAGVVVLKRGNPMVRWDTACLELKDTGTWQTYAANASSIGSAAPLSTVLANLNNTAPMLGTRHPTITGYRNGFQWMPSDVASTQWIPQGLTAGSVGGRTLAIASWHFEPTASTTKDRGTRVSIVDVTSLSGASVKYRNVLLVEPTSATNFVPITNHAGGVAVFGHLLYEADTGKGVRVFDLNGIRKVSTAESCAETIGTTNGVSCAFGYAYVLPQVGGYYFPSKLSDGSTLTAACKPKFSYVGAAPMALLSGEYCKANDTASPCDLSPATGLAGRLYRWPMAADGKLVASNGFVKPVGAWLMNEPNIQGVTAVLSGGAPRDTFWLGSTVGGGMLARVSPTKNARELRYADRVAARMLEGVQSTADGVGLWVITEGVKGVTDPAAGGRIVYLVDQATVD